MKPRRWFQFSFRLLLAAVTGAAAGLGAAPIWTSDLPVLLKSAVLGQAGAFGLAVGGLNRSWTAYAITGGMAVTYALYAAALAQWPRWSTVIHIAVAHFIGGLVFGLVLAAAP